MSVYAEMFTTLQKREAELLQELQRVRGLMENIRPLVGEQGELSLPRPDIEVVQIPIRIENKTARTAGWPGTTHFRIVSAPRTLVEAARRALMTASGPLHIKEIVETIRGWEISKGRSSAQIRASLAPALIRRKDLFRALGRGMYELVREQEEPKK